MSRQHRPRENCSSKQAKEQKQRLKVIRFLGEMTLLRSQGKHEAALHKQIRATKISIQILKSKITLRKSKQQDTSIAEKELHEKQILLESLNGE